MKKIDIDDALRPKIIDIETWHQLTALSECFSCSAGERLHEEGTVDKRLIFVLSGLVSLNREVAGKDHRSGLMKRPGEILASASLHVDTPKFYSNVVNSDRAVVLITQEADTMTLCESNPAFMRMLFHDIAYHHMLTLGYIVQNREMDAEKRVAYRLEELYARRGDVELTQAEIANVAATSRATVSKTLTLLEAEGIISRKYGEILVLEPNRLKTWPAKVS